MKFLTIILILFSFQTIGREAGQTEITTEEGIEVFKKEKYYLLKKNVKITSDEFELNADLVKAYFDEGLYDIEKIYSNGNVILTSSKGIRALGEKIDFDINSTEDHLALQTEYYVENCRVSDKLTDIMLLFNPTDAFPYYIKGVAFSESNFTLSEKYLKRASTLEINPNMNQLTCRVLGDLYLKNQLPEKASEQYMKCYQFGEVSDLVENGLEIANDMIGNKWKYSKLNLTNSEF